MRSPRETTHHRRSATYFAPTRPPITRFVERRLMCNCHEVSSVVRTICRITYTLRPYRYLYLTSQILRSRAYVRNVTVIQFLLVNFPHYCHSQSSQRGRDAADADRQTSRRAERLLAFHLCSDTLRKVNHSSANRQN